MYKREFVEIFNVRYFDHTINLIDECSLYDVSMNLWLHNITNVICTGHSP